MIKKLLIFLLLIVLAVYLVVASTFLNHKSNEAICEAVDLVVTDSIDYGFISNKDILNLLNSQKISPVGLKINEINTNEMEEIISKQPFVESVDCYKTPGNKIGIKIRQRVPLLRVMANNGENYYVDQKGETMPVPTGSTAYVPIITGNVSKDFAKKELYAFGLFLRDNSLWNAQIEQINVTAQRELELIPRVGENVIFLGKPENYEEKLDRLKTFYEKGLNKVGWNKYSRISLEFNNQIICTKR
jgi:cell division protein FtsQ